jgi:hypothetical protein
LTCFFDNRVANDLDQLALSIAFYDPRPSDVTLPVSMSLSRQV